MAKKKRDRTERDRMECRHCGSILTVDGCCEGHRKALAKEKPNLCTVCGKYFKTKAELASHSHKEAA